MGKAERWNIRTLGTMNQQLEIGRVIHGKKEWGGLRNKKRVQCPEKVGISLYGGDDLAEFFRTRPSAPLRPLGDAIKGMGPTYLSKVLMFSRPQLYGAIDTRLVRVFGRGDTDNEPFRWLLLGLKTTVMGGTFPNTRLRGPANMIPG